MVEVSEGIPLSNLLMSVPLFQHYLCEVQHHSWFQLFPKYIPGVDFTNIFTRTFGACRSQKHKKLTTWLSFLRFWALRTQKLLVKHLWNWHLISVKCFHLDDVWEMKLTRSAKSIDWFPMHVHSLISQILIYDELDKFREGRTWRWASIFIPNLPSEFLNNNLFWNNSC